jgi:hypothetical protein
MKTLLIPSFSLAAAFTALATEPMPVEIPTFPTYWPTALPILSPERTVLVLDKPGKTLLRGYLAPWKQAPAATAPEIHRQTEEIIKTLPTDEEVELKIDWLGSETPENFHRTLFPTAGIARSRCRIAGATITRTVLVNPNDGSIFIHLLANKPGALSFRVSLDVSGTEKSVIEDRRQLVRSTPDTDPASISAHVWVIPFESDVSPDGDAIIVRGEGEALILLTYATGPQAPTALANAWKKLGDLHDPGQSPPSPDKIWHAILGERRKSIENSP